MDAEPPCLDGRPEEPAWDDIDAEVVRLDGTRVSLGTDGTVDWICGRDVVDADGV